MWPQQDPEHYVTTSLQYLVTSGLSLCSGWDGLGLRRPMVLSPAPSTEPSASNRPLCAQSLFSCLHKQASFTNQAWIVERRNQCWPESPCDSAFLPSVYENAEIWILLQTKRKIMFYVPIWWFPLCSPGTLQFTSEQWAEGSIWRQSLGKFWNVCDLLTGLPAHRASPLTLTLAAQKAECSPGWLWASGQTPQPKGKAMM